MKRTTLIGLLSLVLGLMLVGITVFAQGTTANRHTGGCACCRGSGGNMMGYGSMHQGRMNCWDGCGHWIGYMSGYGTNHEPWQKMHYDDYGNLIEPLTKEQAEEIAQYHVDWTENPNLKVGEIVEKPTVFEISIVTKDDSLVNKLVIEKATGSVHLQMQ